jgi:hypothetical protein
MNEQQDHLERELKAMLSVDPSPDLRARIRARAFSATPKRTPYPISFAWTSGLAAAAAAILLIAIYSGPKVSEVSPNPPAIAEERETPKPVETIQTAPTPVRQSRALRKANNARPEPRALLVSIPMEAAPPPPTEIRLPALKALPQEPFPVAGLQQLNIEPPMLIVPNLE